MKYNVGDLLLVKFCEFKPRISRTPRPVILPYFYFRLCRAAGLFNSYGIVTQVIKSIDAWEGESTSDDNVYIWFSQVDGKEYCFCENQITGEVVE